MAYGICLYFNLISPFTSVNEYDCWVKRPIRDKRGLLNSKNMLFELLLKAQAQRATKMCPYIVRIKNFEFILHHESDNISHMFHITFVLFNNFSYSYYTI